ALPVVVEVGVDLGVAPPLREAAGPGREFRLRVVAVTAAAAVVKSDVGPVRRPDRRRADPARALVTDHGSGAVLAEPGVAVVGEPARGAELEGVPAVAQRGEGLRETHRVAMKVRRELPEKRTELLGPGERFERLVEALHALLDHGEALD